MSSIHGVNVGGSLFGVTDSSNVAPLELTGSATRSYAKGRLLILSDGLLYKTLTAINSGTALVANSNIKLTNLDEVIAAFDTDSDLIAPTEEGATSGDDYSVGDQIARSGLLYEVIFPITAGDTFVVGNNIQLAGSVTKQLSAYKIELATRDAEIADMNNVLGAKNIFKYPYPSAFLAGDGRSNFEVADDGTIHTTSADATGVNDTITLIRIVGTGATAKAIAYSEELASILKLNPYVISGGSEETKLVVDYYEDDTWISKVENDGSGDTPLNLPSNCNRIAIYYITPGTAAPITQTLKPMIRLASITDDSFVPYSMTNREMTPYVQAISNPNLLDNPWFTVNQRGASQYTESGYTVDRWKNSNGSANTVEVASGYISYVKASTTSGNPQLSEKLEGALSAGKYTLSVKYKTTRIGLAPYESSYKLAIKKDNTILSELWLPTSSTWAIEKMTFSLTSDITNADVFIQDYGVNQGVATIGDTIDIACIKLELGSVSTLAMDTAPNYATELLKCQRYFYKTVDTSDGQRSCKEGIAMSNKYISGFSFPVVMRTTPTFTNVGVNKFLTSAVAITATFSVNATQEGVTSISGSDNPFTIGEAYYIHLEASADL